MIDETNKKKLSNELAISIILEEKNNLMSVNFQKKDPEMVNVIVDVFEEKYKKYEDKQNNN